jgi:RimJ/RimL family protein N-acetyltransferase
MERNPGARAMTLLDQKAAEAPREQSVAVLETERLVLRAPRAEDAQAMASLVNDRRIAENTARIPHPYTLTDAETFIASANTAAGQRAFLITSRDGGILGGCGVGTVRSTIPEIGYWLGVAFWARGYATEAARAVIDHAFTDLGHERLEAGARVSNPGSRRVLEKCGFQWTHVGLYRVRALNSSVPVDRFRLDRGLWASRRNWGKVRGMA